MKKQLTRFSLIEIMFWCTWAAQGAFNVTYGLSRGYAQSLVSMAYAFYFVCAFVGLSLFSSLSDRLRTNKKLFIAGLAASWLILLAMFLIKSEAVFIITYGLFGLSMGPLSSLLDTWVLKSINGDVSLYSKARGLGSMGYAIFILIVGQLIKYVDYWVMPIASGITTLATLYLSIITPDAPYSATEKEKVSFKDILSVLKNKLFLLVMIVVLLVGLSISPINNLKIMVLEKVNGDVGTQGIDSFIGAMVQFAMFYVAGRLAVIPSKQRLLLGSVTVLIGILLNFFATSVWMVILGTCFLFGSYSIVLPAARQIVVDTIDYRYQTTANGLVDSGYSFIAGTVALLFAGMIAEKTGVDGMILVTLGISIVPVLMTAVIALRDKNRG